MEYNLHRDFNESFSTAFKRYTDTDDLLAAVDRYITTQGNQAGLHNLAEILFNMVYNYTPSIEEAVLPIIMDIIRHNASQAGIQDVVTVLKAIIDEGITNTDTKTEGKALADAFAEQNDNQLGLPIIYGEEDNTYTFGAYLKDLIQYIA